jgi:hypothetical protein
MEWWHAVVLFSAIMLILEILELRRQRRLYDERRHGRLEALRWQREARR